MGQRLAKLCPDGAPYLTSRECHICCSVYSHRRPAAPGSLIKREGGATGPAAGATRDRTERRPPGSAASAAAGEGWHGAKGARDTAAGGSQSGGGPRAAGLPSLRRHPSRVARRVPSPGLPLPTSPPAPLFLFVVATLRPGRPSPPAPLRSLPGNRGPPLSPPPGPGARCLRVGTWGATRRPSPREAQAAAAGRWPQATAVGLRGFIYLPWNQSLQTSHSIMKRFTSYGCRHTQYTGGGGGGAEARPGADTDPAAAAAPAAAPAATAAAAPAIFKKHTHTHARSSAR